MSRQGRWREKVLKVRERLCLLLWGLRCYLCAQRYFYICRKYGVPKCMAKDYLYQIGSYEKAFAAVVIDKYLG